MEMRHLAQRIASKIAGGGKAAQENEMQYLLSHGLTIGENFRSYSPYAFDANWPWLITVGNDVMLSTNVKVLAHDASTGFACGRTKIGIVSIGDHVFIGTNSTVLCNVRIGSNVIVGANSVVTHDLPSNGVYAGNPAKRVCSFEEYCEKHSNGSKVHPLFTERKWDTWKDASPAEWEAMRDQLKDTFGYI